jgi:alkylation response protein AidB-like acyl-CoA dehydrogenase
LWTAFCQELGLAGAALPEAYGGADLGQVEFAILTEAAGAHIAALPILGIAMAARSINAGGSDTQKDNWLPKLIKGELIGAYAEAFSIEEKGGKLSGTFNFVTHGGSSDIIVIGSPDGAWIVDRNAPGLDVKMHTTMDQTRPLATLNLSEVEAQPLENGKAAYTAARQGGWLCLAAEALGGAQACLDRTVEYSLERVQFGRQIGSFQAYKHRLADMVIEIEQLRSAVYWASASMDEDAPNTALALHSAKSFAADTYAMCAGNMIQLHGGIGFTWEHDAHLFFKRARSIGSMFGSPAWHREKIAQLILGEAA